MDIYPLGHASFRIKGKTATIVTDPYDPSFVGLKFPKIDSPDILTLSHDHPDHNFTSVAKGETTFVVSGPGEYEIKGVFILGIETDHDNKKGAERGKNVVFKVSLDEIRLVHLGDLGRRLTDDEVRELGDVDILFVPTGGTYTIDAKTAAEIVTQIGPSIVIPMHYQRPGMSPKLAEALEPVSKFLKETGADSITPQPKLSISKDKLPETTTVVVLE